MCRHGLIRLIETLGSNRFCSYITPEPTDAQLTTSAEACFLRLLTTVRSDRKTVSKFTELSSPNQIDKFSASPAWQWHDTSERNSAAVRTLQFYKAVLLPASCLKTLFSTSFLHNTACSCTRTPLNMSLISSITRHLHMLIWQANTWQNKALFTRHAPAD